MKLNIVIAILLFFSLKTNYLIGQKNNQVKHTISIFSGYTYYTTYEPILSSVRQSSTFLTTGFEYSKKNKEKHQLSFKLILLPKTDLTSRLSNDGFRAPNKGEIFGGSFEFLYQKLLRKKGTYMYLGLHLNGVYLDKSLNVISFDDARAVDLFLDLGPSFSITKDLGKHQIKANLNLPFIGYVAAKTRNSETFPFDLIERDKNIGTALQYGDIALINDYFNLNFNAEYSFKITSRFLMGLQYGFQYYDYKKEAPFNVQAISYRFLLQAKYQF
ncbi:hypothetical protein [Polaribacter sp. R77954]|uniref:hypothetical protein n=1 Tax=Polaribacter sp. R77954 TaxID=3093870 RepID=UPI0037C84443